MSKPDARLTPGEIMQATRTNGLGIAHVDVDLLPLKPEVIEDLEFWMRGQTVPVVDGVRFAAYPWDIQRWAKNLPIID